MKKIFYTDISDIEMVNGSTRIMCRSVYQLIKARRLHKLCKNVLTVRREIKVAHYYDPFIYTELSNSLGEPLQIASWLAINSYDIYTIRGS